MTDFQYEVFLSHNAADKPQVRRLAERRRSAETLLRIHSSRLLELVIEAGD